MRAGLASSGLRTQEHIGHMPDFLSISLKGDSISLPDLADALGDFTTVLGEVEREVTGRRDIQWKVSGLERASATVSVTPIQLPGTLLDQRGEAIGSLVGGLGKLVASPDRPPHFNDRTLQSARRLARRRNGRITDVVLVGAFEDQPTIRVSLEARIVSHIDVIIGISGYALGALEGRLETITIHDQHAFTIYDALRSRGTKCICDPETFDAIRLLLGKRVLVYGEIGYSKTGEPTTIRVERFESLRTTDVLPQAGEVRGIYADSPVSASDHADFLREH